MRSRILVANWKMYLDYQQSCNWLATYAQELIKLCQNNHAVKIILCPSTIALSYAHTILEQAQTKLFQNTLSAPCVALGAQDVSAFNKGAYTGQTNAESLAQAGVRYCLLGHHEHELYLGHTKNQAPQKAALLLQAGITPIVLVGEKTKTECWKSALIAQIALFNNLDTTKLLYAYEPAWSIGTGNILTPSELEERIRFIRHLVGGNKHVLYGGSVNETTIMPLLSLELDGFLLGAISTDFQMLKKIVNLV